jgi:hypothetical protein
MSDIDRESRLGAQGAPAREAERGRVPASDRAGLRGRAPV